jgi:hypothetical protein
MLMNAFAVPMDGTVTMNKDAQSATGERAALSLTFVAADCLLAAIRTALAGRHPALIDVPRLGAVWIDPASRLYAAMVLHPVEFFRTPSVNARITFGVAQPMSAKRRPVEELLWLAGFHGSGGALLDRCHPHDVVELKYWPNLTRLPQTPGTIRFCALLMRGPTAISLAYRILHMPPQEALQIYSAATAAEMIRIVSAVHADKTAPSSGRHTPVAQRVAGFWESMLKRIVGL